MPRPPRPRDAEVESMTPGGTDRSWVEFLHNPVDGRIEAGEPDGAVQVPRRECIGQPCELLKRSGPGVIRWETEAERPEIRERDRRDRALEPDVVWRFAEKDDGFDRHRGAAALTIVVERHVDAIVPRQRNVRPRGGVSVVHVGPDAQ